MIRICDFCCRCNRESFRIWQLVEFFENACSITWKITNGISRLLPLHGLKPILFVEVMLLQFPSFLYCLIFSVCFNVFGNIRILERRLPCWMVNSCLVFCLFVAKEEWVALLVNASLHFLLKIFFWRFTLKGAISLWINSAY